MIALLLVIVGLIIFAVGVFVGAIAMASAMSEVERGKP